MVQPESAEILQLRQTTLNDPQYSATGGSAEPIAIVGVGCKLPGDISTVAKLAAALREGRDCITEVPPDRWDVEALYDPDPVALGKTYVRHGGFVADIDRFDAAFFGISDAEASRTDPQQRMALETVWHALEHAGQSADEMINSNTGVFLAMMNSNNYQQLKTAGEGLAGTTSYDAAGDAISIAAGRISHFFGLEGPCLTIDTACSSSLVALHLARQSILAGECDSAIVVGASAILSPVFHIAFSKMGLMSRSGHCKAFDESADGYVRGEGCVAVLLRRQSLAIARRDRILASIIGTAINHDGRTPAITAPNRQAQKKVICAALARAGVKPEEIGYIEAHGTGTPIGDPIEMGALVDVYGAQRRGQQPLYVGSSKSNFGHIEAGAGLLGVVKAALSLEQGTIFPSLHFKRLNSNIELGGAPLQVPVRTIPWSRGQRERLAGINSFGFSGTNAHAILREGPRSNDFAAAAARPCELVVLSAKSPVSLQELADQWIEFLKEDSPTPLRDIAFTAATGRAHLRHRLAVVSPSKDEVSEKLQFWRKGRKVTGLVVGEASSGRKLKAAFVFTGQGAQYAGMGQQLYESEPRFKTAIDRCSALMEPELGSSLVDVLFGSESAKFLANTRYVQPALFAIEYALADLLTDQGIEPEFVIGHSVGEIVAACVADLVSLEDAARFIVMRGRLMGELPHGGTMLAIDATAEQVEDWLQGKQAEASIAAINGPRSVVVSGTSTAVHQVGELAGAAGHRAKQLDVSHAFHSPLMEPILPKLAAAASSMRIRAPKIPVLSNLTGEFLNTEISSEYWSSHVRQAVLFHRGMCKIMESDCSIVVEVGPHPTLTPSITAAFETSRTRCVPTLMRDRRDVSHMLETLASLYARGAAVNFENAFRGAAYRRVSLPLYPFRRARHWLRTDQGFPRSSKVEPAAPSEAKIELHPLLGRVVSVAPHRTVYESSLAATEPWVDHRILGNTIFPGTAYLEMAARGFAAAKRLNWQSMQLRDITFERPLVLAYGTSKKVRTTFDSRQTNGSSDTGFTISAADGSAETYCRGRIAVATELAERASIEAERHRLRSPLQIGPFYGELRKRGFEYGASFSTIRELWLGGPGSGEAIARVTASPSESDAPGHPFTYTTMLDGGLQVFGAALRTLGESDQSCAFVPHSIRSVTLRNQPFAQLWSHVTVRLCGDPRSLLARIRVVTDAGTVLADIDGLELRPIGKFMLAKNEDAEAADSSISESRDQLLDRLCHLPKGRRVQVLAKWVMSEVTDILGQAAEDLDLEGLDPSTAFIEIGLDSLLITELQRRIQEKLDFRFKPMQGIDYQSAESLAEYILTEVLVMEPTASEAIKRTGSEDRTGA
jgi:acyl transferase domain-containing protein